MQGQLPRHTVATGCYGEELKSTSAMDFTEKLHINLVFPDALINFILDLVLEEWGLRQRNSWHKEAQA